MARVYEDITATVGNTPLVRLRRLAAPDTTVLAKVESFNPCGSVKDRIAVSMVDAAEREGLIGEGTVLIEPTSGNTGIGLAFVCASRGYKLVLTMPEPMNAERCKLLQMLGEIVLTSAAMGMSARSRKPNGLAVKYPTRLSFSSSRTQPTRRPIAGRPPLRYGTTRTGRLMCLSQASAPAGRLPAAAGA